MSIYLSIIEQRVAKLSTDLTQRLRNELGLPNDKIRLESAAFVFLCVKTWLDVDDDEAFDCLTEGGGDLGIDAIHLADVGDTELTVTLFQGKYRRNPDGQEHFPQGGIEKLIQAIELLFNPRASVDYANSRLQARVEELRSLIADGRIPTVRVVACSNGQCWNQATQALIDAKRPEFGDQVTWCHHNHEAMVKQLQAHQPLTATLHFAGKAVVEDMAYSRVLIGRLAVRDVAQLMHTHGNKLLERNIRRYLGLRGNRVNEAIASTLTSDKPTAFYMYNNGITLTCTKFNYNGLQREDHKVHVDNLQIINGGQTCMTIYRTLYPAEGQQLPVENLDQKLDDVYVLVRLYELANDDEALVNAITLATNSQNPVGLTDLRANDERQRDLVTDMNSLGYTYKPKRDDTSITPKVITSAAAAEAVLAVWRHLPHLAKFKTKEHFGPYYYMVFTQQLNGTHVILAVLLYRIAENRRKRPDDADPPLVRYASCFSAMMMGRYLLRDLGLNGSDELKATHYPMAERLIAERGDAYFQHSVDHVQEALSCLFASPEAMSLQQLSATFRRPDLVEFLLDMPLDSQTPATA
jgi:hypothetical protein